MNGCRDVVQELASAVAFAAFVNRGYDLVGREAEVNALDVEWGARGRFRLHDVGAPVPATDSYGAVTLLGVRQGRENADGVT